MSVGISYPAFPVPSPNLPLRSKGCIHLFPLPTGLGSPSQWTTCQNCLQPSLVMTVYSWITSLRWPYWQPAIRASLLKPLLSYSSNVCGFISGYHRISSQIEIASSWAHFGLACGHLWTPNSPSPLPSTPRPMDRRRWSIEWSCISYGFTIINIPAPGMRVSHIFNTTTIEPFTTILATTLFRFSWGSNH